MICFWLGFVVTVVAWLEAAAAPPLGESRSHGEATTVYDTDEPLFIEPVTQAASHNGFDTYELTAAAVTRDATQSYDMGSHVSLDAEVDREPVGEENVAELKDLSEAKELVGESERGETVYPLKGIKSLIIGSILLVIMFLALTSPEDLSSDSNIISKLHHLFGEGVQDLLFEADDFLEEQLSPSPFLVLTPWIILGIAPTLFLTGALRLVRTITKRRGGVSKGMHVPVAFFLISLLCLTTLPGLLLYGEFPNEDESSEYALDAVANYAFGMKVTALFILMAISVEHIRERKRRNVPIGSRLAALSELSSPEGR